MCHGFYLPDGRKGGISISMPVVERDFAAVLMVNADRIAADVIRFLDDPAMPCTLGLNRYREIMSLSGISSTTIYAGQALTLPDA
jgi:hypothetical protein